MQKGRIERKGHAWILRYGVRVHKPDGSVAWAKRSKKLAPVCDDYRSEASVRHLAQEILGPLNTKTARPESTDTVLLFFENVYLPYCLHQQAVHLQRICVHPENTEAALRGLSASGFRHSRRRATVK